MDNITKYYYLIVFTAYMREAADLAREAVADDKKADFTISGGKCAIPADQLKAAKSFQTFMADQPKLRTLIDEGQGDLKKRAKYRFASKTLMRILPSGISKNIEDLIEKKAISLDLYEILGACTWEQPK